MERTQMELRPKAGSQESINFPLCSNLFFFSGNHNGSASTYCDDRPQIYIATLGENHKTH